MSGIDDQSEQSELIAMDENPRCDRCDGYIVDGRESEHELWCASCGEHVDDEHAHCDRCSELIGSDCDCYQCTQCDERFESLCNCECSYCTRKQRCAQCCGHGRCSNCECCDENCECYSCDSCGDRYGGDDMCGCGCDCYRCEECCNHSRCNQCDGCSEQCSCDDADDDDEPSPGHRRSDSVFRKFALRFHKSDRTEYRENPLHRFLSVEIEVAGSDSHSAVIAATDKWRCSVVEDGSLPSGGYEINTAPADGDKFTTLVRELCTAIQSDGGGVTKDCGLHVHVDARDLRPLQVRALVELYCAVEPLMFALCSESRQRSTYAERCGAEYRQTILTQNGFKNKELKKSAIGAVYGDTALDGKGAYYRSSKKQHRAGNRYYALNLHSYFYRGTVEFRHHQGSVNAEKIIHWAELCGHLVDAANRLGIRRIQTIAQRLRQASQYRDMVRELGAIIPVEVTTWMTSRLQHFGRSNATVQR